MRTQKGQRHQFRIQMCWEKEKEKERERKEITHLIKTEQVGMGLN